MDATIHGPSFWKSLDSMDTPSFCIDRLEKLKSRLQWKQRQKLRENNGVYLTYCPPFPLQLEKYLRTHFTYNFLMQSTIGTHLQHLCSIEVGFMLRARRAGTWSLVVRKRNLCWQNTSIIYRLSIKTLSGKPPLQADKVRDELVATLDVPPTFHEFCNSISSKSGKTLGGITGLTYDHMKA